DRDADDRTLSRRSQLASAAQGAPPARPLRQAGGRGRGHPLSRQRRGGVRDRRGAAGGRRLHGSVRTMKGPARAMKSPPAKGGQPGRHASMAEKSPRRLGGAVPGAPAPRAPLPGPPLNQPHACLTETGFFFSRDHLLPPAHHRPSGGFLGDPPPPPAA